MQTTADHAPSTARPRPRRALRGGSAPAFGAALLAAPLAWAAVAWNTAETPSSDPAGSSAAPALPEPLPSRLSGTGLYMAGSTTLIAPENAAFVPQYPLWSDGATKRRWIALPPGTLIDGSNPDAWVFPIGTRLWKEFSFGERTETRYMERLADGSYRYAAYVWDAALGDALLAPEAGIRGAHD